MHELSIAEGIVEVVENVARQNHVTTVKTVKVAIGELAGVDIEALLFAWKSASMVGVTKGATLEIERPSGKAWCLQCAKTVPLNRYGDPCPLCGSFQLQATDGTQMKVIDIVVND